MTTDNMNIFEAIYKFHQGDENVPAGRLKKIAEDYYKCCKKEGGEKKKVVYLSPTMQEKFFLGAKLGGLSLGAIGFWTLIGLAIGGPLGAGIAGGVSTLAYSVTASVAGVQEVKVMTKKNACKVNPLHYAAWTAAIEAKEDSQYGLGCHRLRI